MLTRVFSDPRSKVLQALIVLDHSADKVVLAVELKGVRVNIVPR